MVFCFIFNRKDKDQEDIGTDRNERAGPLEHPAEPEPSWLRMFVAVGLDRRHGR